MQHLCNMNNQEKKSVAMFMKRTQGLRCNINTKPNVQKDTKSTYLSKINNNSSKTSTVKSIWVLSPVRFDCLVLCLLDHVWGVVLPGGRSHQMQLHQKTNPGLGLVTIGTIRDCKGPQAPEYSEIYLRLTQTQYRTRFLLYPLNQQGYTPIPDQFPTLLHTLARLPPDMKQLLYPLHQQDYPLHWTNSLLQSLHQLCYPYTGLSLLYLTLAARKRAWH